MGWNCASIWYHPMDPVFFYHNFSVSSLLLSKPCDEMFNHISHSWLKHLNFHFENLQDSITISSFLVWLIGLPAPNGLIPQAPIHTKSLIVTSTCPSQSQNAQVCRLKTLLSIAILTLPPCRQVV